MPKISALPPMTSADGDDPAPIVDNSAGSTKKITLTKLKEWLQSVVGWITTAMVSDDAITAAKIDWNSTGSNAGIWWEELGRTTLASANDTITVSGITPRKHLRIIAYTPDSGGTISHTIILNNDSAANYARRRSESGAADQTATSVTNLVAATQVAAKWFTTLDVVNITNQEKLAHGFTTHNNGNGAGNIPTRIEQSGKWANTSAQISRVDLINSGAGDYASGSVLIVLGHD